MSLDPHRYLQQGCVRDDVSGPDIDTARRTNRFANASNAGRTAVCACTQHQARHNVIGCDVRRINIIICPGRAATCKVDESSDRENKTPSDDHRNMAETANYLEDASSGFITMLQDTDLTADEENPEDLLSSTPLRAAETEMDSRQTNQATKTMQDKSVRTEFTKDVSLQTRSGTLLDLLRDNRAQPRHCFCSEPRIIPRGTRKVIAVNTMRNIPVCPRWNNARRKIKGRNVARYHETSNDVGIRDSHDASKSKDENRPLGVYNNSPDHEMFRDARKRGDRVVQSISRNYIEDKSNRRKDPIERNAKGVQREWTYVEYLIDDTLKLLKGTNATGEDRQETGGTRRESHDGPRRRSQRVHSG